MSDLFDSYASDLQQLVDGLTLKLETVIPSQSGETRKSTIRRAEMELEEADEVLSQMDIEAQGFPQSVRTRYTAQVKKYRQSIEQLEKQVKSVSLNSGGGNGKSYHDDLEANNQTQDDQVLDQRQRLLQGTTSLEDGTRRLEESNRLALETESLGADILRDLRGQRDQLEHSRDTLRQADQNIDRSSKTLSRMIRRAKQQKLVTMGIIVILVLLILLILYSKLF